MSVMTKAMSGMKPGMMSGKKKTAKTDTKKPKKAVKKSK